MPVPSSQKGEAAPAARPEVADLYAAVGVDVAAGDRAVELMKRSVAATHGPAVLGGVGGFAGLWDASALADYRHPVLATSTDGVGTKVAIAQAMDRHDTIGQDLVGMVVDDIVVVGATPLFLTDYIACGRVVPERIAEVVGGVARACTEARTALVGGETAEHPDLLGPQDYDLAGAAVGVVERDRLLGPDRVGAGDVVLALGSSGLHSNGYSLVRRIVRDAGLDLRTRFADLGAPLGEALLTPTRLYTAPLLDLLAGPHGGGVHAVAHVTGGGIAANLARVLPPGAAVDLDRSTWSPPAVFRVLAAVGGFGPADVESTWNLGIGMIVVAAESDAPGIVRALLATGVPTWVAGEVQHRADASTETKGVTGGAVRLVSAYAD